VEKWPDPGDVVIFNLVDSSEAVAAVVAHVHRDGSTCNLCAFMPDGSPSPVREAAYGGSSCAPGTWRWREDADGVRFAAPAAQQDRGMRQAVLWGGAEVGAVTTAEPPAPRHDIGALGRGSGGRVPLTGPRGGR
jgi:hypothetical protein